MVAMYAEYGQIDGYIWIFVIDGVVGGDCRAEVFGLVGYDLEGDGVGSHGISTEDVHCFVDRASRWFVFVE